jgi:hypothetical protein
MWQKMGGKKAFWAERLLRHAARNTRPLRSLPIALFFPLSRRRDRRRRIKSASRAKRSSKRPLKDAEECGPQVGVAAPSLFLPLGLVLVGSPILPRLFGYLAFLLAAVFAALGIIFLLDLTLPGAVTAFAGVQAFWWLAAAITLMVRGGKIQNGLWKKEVAFSQVL